MEINISGFKTLLRPISADRLKGLPIDVYVSYRFYEGEFKGVSLCFLEAKNSTFQSTPAKCKKISIKVYDSLQLPIVFLFDNLPFVIRQRMIEQGVYFVVPGKYANLPNLFVNALNTSEQVKSRGKLSPVAQYILLYYLQHHNCKFNNIKAIQHEIDFSYMQITRAVVDLERFGLCTTKTLHSVEKRIAFTEDKNSLWQRAQEFLRSPVLKVMFTDDQLPEDIGRIAGINALAYYTDLNRVRQQILAVDKATFSEIEKAQIELNPVEGKSSIQVWIYPPTIMTDNIVVDPLSLWLTLKGDNNPRVETALENLINNITW